MSFQKDTKGKLIYGFSFHENQSYLSSYKLGFSFENLETIQFELKQKFNYVLVSEHEELVTAYFGALSKLKRMEESKGIVRVSDIEKILRIEKRHYHFIEWENQFPSEDRTIDCPELKGYIFLKFHKIRKVIPNEIRNKKNIDFDSHLGFYSQVMGKELIYNDFTFSRFERAKKLSTHYARIEVDFTCTDFKEYLDQKKEDFDFIAIMETDHLVEDTYYWKNVGYRNILRGYFPIRKISDIIRNNIFTSVGHIENLFTESSEAEQYI